MERIIIHDLKRYKLIFSNDLSVGKAHPKSEEVTETINNVQGNKLADIQVQRPLEGWVPVTSPDVAFKIADSNRLKISKDYLVRLNPSSAFLENRRKSKDSDEPSKKKKRSKKK